MTTAISLIKSSLRLIGVLDPNETPAAEDAETGLETLNAMIDAWNGDSLMLYAQQDLVSTASGPQLLIGPGEALDTTYAGRIQSAFYRMGGYDYPLKVISQAEYDKISDKAQDSLPQVVVYDRSYPVGRLTVWPASTQTLEYHFLVSAQIIGFGDLTTEFTLPPGYERAMRYSLAEELGMAYARPANVQLVTTARAARKQIKQRNFTTPMLERAWYAGGGCGSNVFPIGGDPGGGVLPGVGIILTNALGETLVNGDGVILLSAA